MGLAVVRDMREARVPEGPEELAGFETDVLAGFVLARAAAGLSDRTISADVSRAQALKTYFAFLELRHKAEVYQLTGHVAECPIDEMNRPRGGQGQAALRIPPEAGQVERLFAGW